jgi:hypothetical protein
MIEKMKVWDRVFESLRFFSRQCNGNPWNANVYVECARMGVSDKLMEDLLVHLTKEGYVSMTSWSKTLGREAYPWEFPSRNAFFYNSDDGNHVRVKPLIAF